MLTEPKIKNYLTNTYCFRQLGKNYYSDNIII